MIVPDELIERLMLAAGHVPGDAVRPVVLRAAFGLLADEAVAACREIEARYPPRPGLFIDKTQEPQRECRTTAGNCVRAVQERLSGSGGPA